MSSTSRLRPPLRVAVIGLGGYAYWHHRAIIRLENEGVLHLVAACDPRPDAFLDHRQEWRFAERGVRLFHHYGDLLAECARELDYIVIPTPIALHAEMHRAAVESGVPVYLEKPPTLDPTELERMIQLDERAVRATQVGFNFIVEPARRALKSRLLDGEFGALHRVELLGRWPRPDSYFTRNDWAARLLGPDTRPILDSCLANALAHYVHNCLHWAGPRAVDSWAECASVRASLHRAHAIEGADTFFVEVRTPSDLVLRFALSHACAGEHINTETLRCEHADLVVTAGVRAEIRHRDGRVEHQDWAGFDPPFANHLSYAAYLRGELPRPPTTLADSRPFVTVNALAYLSAGRIDNVPPEKVSVVCRSQGNFRDITGLEHHQAEFLARGVWPSLDGSNLHPPPLPATPCQLPDLPALVRRLAAPSFSPTHS